MTDNVRKQRCVSEQEARGYYWSCVAAALQGYMARDGLLMHEGPEEQAALRRDEAGRIALFAGTVYREGMKYGDITSDAFWNRGTLRRERGEDV
jgi:hypothetical protein